MKWDLEYYRMGLEALQNAVSVSILHLQLLLKYHWQFDKYAVKVVASEVADVQQAAHGMWPHAS
jgi:hypothetical protein